ncbi:MAG: hypothetical protein GXO08_04955 [Aquificae bacterium]|nr:hypothetical protein [Aquificota bacterium]
MGTKERLLADHERLKNFSFTPEDVELLKRHHEEEERFFEEHAAVLGGDGELSPLEMVRREHRLLLELLERGERELFLDLLRYHLHKEETQIYAMLD